MRMYAGLIGVALLWSAALLGRAALAQPQTGTIKINQPANGAMVSAPVTLQVDIGGVTVKPAAEGDPNAFHYHALVDVDPVTVVQVGQPIPTGQANIIHTADRTMMLPDLTPGQHTVTVILTRTDHVPLMPSIQDRVTFTVVAPGAAAPAMPAGAQPTATAAQPAAAPAAGAAASPRTGRGGAVLIDNRASTAMAATLAGVLVLSVAGAAVYARRRVRN